MLTRFEAMDLALWLLILLGVGHKIPYLDVATPGVLVMVAVSALILSSLMWVWRSQVVEMLILSEPKLDWLCFGLSAAGKVAYLSVKGESFLAILWAVAAVSVYGFIAGLLIRKNRAERDADG